MNNEKFGKLISEALNISVVELLKGEKDKKENEDLILNAINLYKEETKKKSKKKKRNIFIVTIITLLIVLGIVLLIWQINRTKYVKTMFLCSFIFLIPEISKEKWILKNLFL